MGVTKNARLKPRVFYWENWYAECSLETHTVQCFDRLILEISIVTRVHFALFVLSFASLQSCSTTATVAPSNAAVSAGLSPSKIVRFADALGAVSDVKLESMLAAFDYCDREQRLAFVTPPLAYSPRINYSHVSTYSNRLADDPSAKTFVAPFECIDQKHSVKTGLLESEDIPSISAIRSAMSDSRGGVIVHRANALSKFKESDIVVKVGNFRVETRAELVKAVDLSPVGEVDFTVVRCGKRLTISGDVHDTTASMSQNALKLLEALCKESAATSRVCARHSFLASRN
jgi:hypothetical protein